jgi:hypothetical protein
MLRLRRLVAAVHFSEAAAHNSHRCQGECRLVFDQREKALGMIHNQQPG